MLVELSIFLHFLSILILYSKVRNRDEAWQHELRFSCKYKVLKLSYVAVVPHVAVTTVMMTWIMKLTMPTRNIARRLIFVLVQSSDRDGFVANFRILLLSLMKELIPILSSRPYGMLLAQHGIREILNWFSFNIC